MKQALHPALQRDIENVTQISAVPALLNIICRTTGMGFSAVARVTDDRWITCVSQDEINFGLGTGDELDLNTTICNEIRQHKSPVVIEEVSKSVEYCNHATPTQYGFQSYISYPIFRKNGDFFGTLCAIDAAPAKLETKEVRDLFELYTQLISFHLDAMEEVAELSKSLQEEKHIGELRETFIAILGHDLRNPVGTTRMCADILLQMDLPELGKRQATTIKSTSYRMQGLIDNLLDFAKGHLGEGIRLELSADQAALKKLLEQVSNEITTVDIVHEMNLTIDLEDAFEVDINRISQLYSNLLGNAVKHGAVDQPINSEITSQNGVFSIKVTNAGDKIPVDRMANLFKPFFTTNAANNKSGLGLGLYISSEIAKAHSGKIDVSSTDERTIFEFIMPIPALSS